METGEIRLKPRSRTLTGVLDIKDLVVVQNLDDARTTVGQQDLSVKSKEYIEDIYPNMRDAIRDNKLSLDQAALILREVGILKFN